MLFHTLPFLLFMLVVLPVFYLLRRTPLWIPWLLAASYFFYGWWNPADLPFLVLSIALNYATARTLRGLPPGHGRRVLLTIGITGNLVFLGYCKYAGFLVSNANAIAGTSWPVPHRSLPLAISFLDRKSTRLNSSHSGESRMPSSA